MQFSFFKKRKESVAWKWLPETWHRGAEERLVVLVEAECGICKHTWDIQGLECRGV